MKKAFNIEYSKFDIFSRFGIRNSILRCFRFLSTVRAPSFHTLLNATGIKHPADNLVTKVDVFHATTAKKYDCVLLQVVSHTRNVGCYFHAICKTHTSDFANGRVWLTRSLGRYLCADSSLEWRVIKHRPVFEDVKTPGKRRRFRLARCTLSLSFY